MCPSNQTCIIAQPCICINGAVRRKRKLSSHALELNSSALVDSATRFKDEFLFSSLLQSTSISRLRYSSTCGITMSEEPMPTKPHFVESSEWDAHNEDYRVTIIHNDKQFIIRLFRDYIQGYDETNSIEGKWLDEFIACTGDDGKENELMRKMEDRIEALSLPFIQNLRPARRSQKLNLHDCLNPETFTFQIATKHGEATNVGRPQLSSDEDRRPP